MVEIVVGIIREEILPLFLLGVSHRVGAKALFFGPFLPGVAFGSTGASSARFFTTFRGDLAGLFFSISAVRGLVLGWERSS